MAISLGLQRQAPNGNYLIAPPVKHTDPATKAVFWLSPFAKKLNDDAEADSDNFINNYYTFINERDGTSSNHKIILPDAEDPVMLEPLVQGVTSPPNDFDKLVRITACCDKAFKRTSLDDWFTQSGRKTCPGGCRQTLEDASSRHSTSNPPGPAQRIFSNIEYPQLVRLAAIVTGIVGFFFCQIGLERLSTHFVTGSSALLQSSFLSLGIGASCVGVGLIAHALSTINPRDPFSQRIKQIALKVLLGAACITGAAFLFSVGHLAILPVVAITVATAITSLAIPLLYVYARFVV